MMLANALLLALREIRRNLLRSLLTVLGVVIGVAAVITMVTLGDGATLSVQRQISSLGSNLLMVRPGQRVGPGSVAAGAPPFRDADVEAIVRDVGGVRAVAPEARAGVTVVANGRNWSTSITGSTNAWLASGNWKLASGRTFEEAEERSGTAVCIVGATVVRELFGSADPLGERLRVKQFSCDIVGVLASKGRAAMGMDQDDVVLLPLATVQRRVTGTQRVDSILVSMSEGSDAGRIKAAVREILRERRKLAESDDDNFNVLDTRELAEAVSGTTRVMTALLGAVAAVSLLVGGIGIMNVMLVSVTERTREIGLRLAIGALEREVLLQFLVEAAALSTLGGAAGIALATLASVVLSAVMQVPWAFNAPINALSFVTSAAIGLLFGYLPARRAARMDPIDALRHE